MAEHAHVNWKTACWAARTSPGQRDKNAENGERSGETGAPFSAAHTCKRREEGRETEQIMAENSLNLLKNNNPQNPEISKNGTPNMINKCKEIYKQTQHCTDAEKQRQGENLGSSQGNMTPYKQSPINRPLNQRKQWRPDHSGYIQTLKVLKERTVNQEYYTQQSYPSKKLRQKHFRHLLLQAPLTGNAKGSS